MMLSNYDAERTKFLEALGLTRCALSEFMDGLGRMDVVLEDLWSRCY